MEEIPSPKSEGQSKGQFSCWGRITLKLPWKRRLTRRCYAHIKSTFMRGKSSAAAGFRYDPLSYAQNFDEGWDHDDDEDQDLSRRTFSARFALPKPLQDV